MLVAFVLVRLVEPKLSLLSHRSIKFSLKLIFFTTLSQLSLADPYPAPVIPDFSRALRQIPYPTVWVSTRQKPSFPLLSIMVLLDPPSPWLLPLPVSYPLYGDPGVEL
jgi:hypothetical protein